MTAKINPGRFISAPMAGITDSPFRKMLRLYFSGLVFTEMVSCTALMYNYKRESRLFAFDEIERPIGIQIFGKDPDHFYTAASLIRRNKPDIVDINMGCPARKVVSSGSGSALLNDRVLSKEIIDSTIEGFKGPVSIKIRLIDKSDPGKTLNFLDYIINDKISFVTIHLRSPKDSFTKPVEYESYKDLIHYSKAKIVVNGGINSKDRVLLLEDLGANHFMVGHAMLGKPFIFQKLRGKEKICPNRDVFQLIADDLELPQEITDNDGVLNPSYLPYIHLLLMHKEKGSRGLRAFRKHFCWYTKGMSGAKEYRNTVFRSDDIDYIKDLILGMVRSG